MIDDVDGVSVRIHLVPSGMTDADRADMDRQIKDQVAEAKRLGIRGMSGFVFWRRRILSRKKLEVRLHADPWDGIDFSPMWQGAPQ